MAVLTGCSPKIDASSVDKFYSSKDAIASSLSPKESAQFKEDCARIGSQYSVSPAGLRQLMAVLDGKSASEIHEIAFNLKAK